MLRISKGLIKVFFRVTQLSTAGRRNRQETRTAHSLTASGNCFINSSVSRHFSELSLCFAKDEVLKQSFFHETKRILDCQTYRTFEPEG